MYTEQPNVQACLECMYACNCVCVCFLFFLIHVCISVYSGEQCMYQVKSANLRTSRHSANMTQVLTGGGVHLGVVVALLCFHISRVCCTVNVKILFATVLSWLPNGLVVCSFGISVNTHTHTHSRPSISILYAPAQTLSRRKWGVNEQIVLHRFIPFQYP